MSEPSLSPLTIGMRLFLICTVGALGLGVVNEITEPRIAAQRTADRDRVIASFIDRGRAGEAVPGSGAVEATYAVRDGERLLGYVAALTGSGYGGELRLLAYYGADGAIRAAKVVESSETPGLGKKAETDEYMAMFRGTGGSRPVPVSKEMLAAGASGAGTRAAGGRVPWIRASRAGLAAWLFGNPAGGPGGGADAVTGATITFRGVSAALAEGSRFVKGLGGGK